MPGQCRSRPPGALGAAPGSRAPRAGQRNTPRSKKYEQQSAFCWKMFEQAVLTQILPVPPRLVCLGLHGLADVFLGHHGLALAIPPTPGGPISPDIAGFNTRDIGCGYSTPDHSRSAADPSPWSTPFEPQNEELQVHVSEYYRPRDLMKGHSSQGLDFRRQSGPGPRCALIWGLKTIPSSLRVSVV